MTVVGLVLLLLPALFYAATTTPAEPKWHLLRQNDYDVIMQRVEMKWYNSSYCRNPKGGLVFYNRTQKAVNASGHLLKDLTNDVTVDVQAYKFASNEYRDFPVRFRINLCREYELNSFGAKDVADKCSNFHHCPLQKGFYYVAYAVPDYSKLPPYIPRGEYKIELKVYHQQTDFLGEAHVFCEIKDKPLKWKE